MVYDNMRRIVKERTETTGVKQKFLAGLCGYKQKTFSLLINGGKTITDVDVEKFCLGMGVTPNDLFAPDPGPSPSERCT